MSTELAKLTYHQANLAIKEKRPLIIPFGTQEAHGPHLPMATDSYCAECLALEIAPLISGLVAPALHYGITNSLFQYGTASNFSKPVYHAFVQELISTYLHQGFNKIVLMNGHGGNTESLVECARVLSVKFQSLIIVVDWWELTRPFLEKYYQGEGSHAGAEETAAILHFLPDLVHHSEQIEHEGTYRQPGYVPYPMDGTIIYGNDNTPSVPDLNEKKAREFMEDTIKVISEKIRKTIFFYTQRGIK